MARSLGSLTVLFVWTVHLVGVSYSAVYTATRKVQDMVEQEEGTLNSLYAAISNHGNGTATECFLKFYHSRIPRVKERQQGQQLEEYLKHPNSIYQVIKEFATEYEHLRAALGSSPPDVQNHLSSMADLSDIAGARVSVLRLQTVYSLNASDMIRGDYFGYMGPELSDVDAFEIGKTAFNEEKFGFAINWLDEALSRAKFREPSFSFYNPDDVDNNKGRIYALLGRSYLRLGNGAKATDMYELARSSDPTAPDVAELRAELANPPEVKPPQDEDADFKRLCTLQNHLTKSKFDRRLVCSYKQAILPYYRFKMELVSVSPYVALFYEVISDLEGQTIMNAARGNLKRGRVESDAGNSIVKESRTSDLSFVPDSDSPIIAGLSKRVAAVTNLVTKPYVEGGDFCSEPFQVVNYGMGGHYAMHFDTFHETSLRTQSNQMYNVYGGNRLATFLIYLTSVERGGATVFPRANLAVAPIKNMALFWYSSNPAGVRHEKTIHAGCPVIYGYKWVSNKWIWLHGNVFSRRCGLRPLTSQMGVDQHMRRGWA